VCEPNNRFDLEIPADALGPVLSAVARLGGHVPHAPTMRGSSCALEGDVPAARVHELRQQLPGLTHGEGVLECAFDRHEPVGGRPPIRARSDPNPVNRDEYLLHLARRVREARR
jgi:ribosomal protection tetracycline resistance protein